MKFGVNLKKLVTLEPPKPTVGTENNKKHVKEGLNLKHKADKKIVHKKTVAKQKKRVEREETNIINSLYSDFSRSTRDGFGKAMLELAKKNSSIIALTADLTSSLRLKDFAEEYPNQFVQVGVAEQNMAGVAAGLALGNKIPYITSYAIFNPGRNWEQIRNTICYSNLHVIVVGGHGGLATGKGGATHQALEDIALTRVLPNMTVVVPCDYEEAHDATIALSKHKGPSYLRLYREPATTNIAKKMNFTIGKADTIIDGRDLTIIACGLMLHEAIKAAENLKRDKIYARVINMHTIKPIDKETIIKAANETRAVITAEDHQKIGGLGSAVAEVLAKESQVEIKKAVKFSMIGVEDSFGESGSRDELYNKYKLSAKNIEAEVKKLLNE